MGRPKETLLLGGRPVLTALLDRWGWQGPTLLVTSPSRPAPPDADRFDRRASDPVENRGPLQGVLVAVSEATTDLVIVMTVDMPNIGRLHVQPLIDEARGANVVGVCYRRRERIEPFPLLIDRSTKTMLKLRLDAGARSVHALATEDRFSVLEAKREWDEDVFENLNTPEDVARWEAAPRTT